MDFFVSFVSWKCYDVHLTKYILNILTVLVVFWVFFSHGLLPTWWIFTGSPTLPLSQSSNRRYCRYCPLINTTEQIVNRYHGRPYTILHDITCNNLVYVITCKICGKQYVGETYGRLYERFQGHFGDLDRNDMKKSVNIRAAAQADRWRIEEYFLIYLSWLRLSQYIRQKTTKF